jgi:2-polyprenyl-3-methyl-5-hydroxy-6-metoxy-1,4-benzoquinol methylase
MDLKEEDILGDKIDTHWYYVSKGRAMRALLGKDLSVDEVLDVGAGSGVFSKQLLDEGLCQRSVCVDPGYKEEREDVHNGKPIRFLKSLDKTTQDLILMMDVLEHVPDDVALLKQYTSSMPKGGKVFITVPAFQFVWSGHDVFLEHYRRYTIKRLRKAVIEAGLAPVKSRYFFATKFPIVAIIRWVKNHLLNHGKIVGKSELRIYPEWFNKTLIFVHDVERILFYPFNRFFGLSVVMICEKP